MSLACLALRQITRRALENRTLAADRVRDSELAPLSTVLKGPDEVVTGPVISLYVDQTSTTMRGREWFSASGTVNLLIEIAAATAVSEESIEIPSTSAGLEITLDLIAYQIRAALLAGDGVWSGLWGRLVSNINSVDTLRGAEFARTGTRFAARQLDLTLQILNDPVPGAIIEPWDEILAAFEADPELDDVAAALRKVMLGESLPPWRREMAEVGDTAGDAVDMGYAPLGSEGSAPLAVVDVVRPVPGGADAVLTVAPAEGGPGPP